jgi:hypothetical protein
MSPPELPRAGTAPAAPTLTTTDDARAGQTFADGFDGTALDRTRWLPHYLPQWSSREASAATHHVAGSCLHLIIPPVQGLWCEGDHEPPLRVSGIQSGCWSGPVGSPRGQQPFRTGQRVRQEQPAFRGWLATAGSRLEMRARMELSARSMASWWLVGFEDEPQRSGELCVFEVFGDALGDQSAAVGAGTHPFRDPDLVEDFAAPRLPIDVREFHTYAVEWRPDGATFLVDGQPFRSVAVTPRYPLQSMVAVFDFPDRGRPGDAPHVPRLVVDEVRGWPLDVGGP